MAQPLVTPNFGVILSIGLVSKGDRMEMVMPLITDGTVVTANNLCSDAVQSVQNNLVPTIQPCLTDSTYISFIAAEGMENGKIPYRLDYASGVLPGTISAIDPLPNNVAVLLAFYADPALLPLGARMRVGKTFIPAVPESLWTGDRISAPGLVLYDALAQMMLVGFASVLTPAKKWYRCTSAPQRGAGVSLCLRAVSAIARIYTGTQRRRLLPH
jgi:hypothetical protein